MSEKERETLINKLIERGAKHIHWQTTIDANPNGIFWHVLHYNNLRTPNTSYELLKFIGKLMDHYYERAEKILTIIAAANRREFEEEISSTFPGFLSLVHNILVFIYRDRPDYIDAFVLHNHTLSLEMRKDANRFDTAWRITSYYSDLLTSYRRKLAYAPPRTQ